MRTLIVSVIFLLAVSIASAQSRSIGIRLGAPTGITYKKDLPARKAFEFTLGTLTNGWYNSYYERSFRAYDRYNGFEYVSHRVRSALYLQGRILRQNEIYIEGMLGELEWYWGVGGLVKFGTVEYQYRQNGGPSVYNTRTDFDFGPEGIIGMEYTFEDIPLTVFSEFSLMLEIVDRPGILRGLSGVGARYNF